MGISTLPIAGASTRSLKHTITASTSITVPSSNGFVFCKIGSSETDVYTAAWVPAASTAVVGALTYYSTLHWEASANIYIYY